MMEKWQNLFAESAFRRNADVAHDLKTPLNVSVLNIELLRMRLAKLLTDAPDAKVDAYIRSVEVELRRMAKIFDAFFVFSVPPRDGKPPEPVDVTACAREAFSLLGVAAPRPAMVVIHPSRLKELFRLVAAVAPKIFQPESIVISEQPGPDAYGLSISGAFLLDEMDVGKIFKFYYTDPSGAPELSLATARLIAETYGGDLELHHEPPAARIQLSLPLGEQ